MNNLYNTINIEELEQEKIDINELVNTYRTKLNSSNILEKGTFRNNNLIGLFDENLWVTRNNMTKGFTYCDFEKFNNLKFKNFNNNDLLLIKSFSAYDLLRRTYKEDENIFTNGLYTRRYLNILYDFIDKSNNFSKEFLSDENGNNIELFFNKKISNQTIYRNIVMVIEYLEFVKEYILKYKGNYILSYITKLELLKDNYNYISNSRELPNSKDILLFDTYVKTFFEDNTVNEMLKLYYYPILLWWKITNVIPMRSSEFCLKIKRDCLTFENDKYYLKIGRIKRKPTKRRNILPTIDRVQISKEIYDLIYDYIEKTNIYGETKTLISYNALISLRKHLDINDELFSGAYHTIGSKIDKNYFTRNVFGQLLISFYNKIIYKKYHDENIKEKISPNDTRHFAFIGLLLQGISPVEIAILGGHKNLKSLDSYTCSYNVYIDTEVITLIRKNISENYINKKNIKNIIFSKKKQPPIEINESMKAEIEGIELGYCTVDINSSTSLCDNEDCYNCSKWWVEPNEYNYNILLSIITKKINTNSQKLKRDIDFILSLLGKVGLEVFNDEIILPKTDKIKIQKSLLNIKAYSNNLINLKTNIIQDTLNSENAIFELNSINEYIQYLEENNNGEEQKWLKE